MDVAVSEVFGDEIDQIASQVRFSRRRP